MPMPTPRKDEDEDDFVSRCMENDGMNDEFPDEKQRVAVCYSQWRDSKKKKKESKSRFFRYLSIQVRNWV
jgi:hypothetical protein